MSPDEKRELIGRLVAAAPDLTPAQRARLGPILRPRSTHRRRAE